MANDVGINFRVDAQTDGLKRAIPDFKAFQDQVSAVLGITDPEVAEAYWQEYNSGLEKSVRIANELSLIQQRNRRAETGGGDEGSSAEKDDDGGGRILPFNYRGIQRAQSAITGIIRGGPRDAVGAGLNTAENILGSAASLPKLGAAASVAVGAGMAAVGAGIIGNELSKAYEGIAPALVEATAALRLFGKTGEEQSAKFQITMNNMSESAARYGYSLEQGLALVTQVTRAGAKVGEEQGIANRVMSISRNLGFSAPVSEFTDLSTLGSRFGQRNALELAIGGANNTVGSPRSREQAAALASMFEDVLGQGIEASFTELSATQNWLYRVFGERAAGSGGAGIFSGLSEAVRGSTSLSSETDILKYQAARNITGGNPLEALMKLEQGFSPELFKEFQKSISGASEWDQTFLVSKAFGVNLSTAKKMLANPNLAAEAYESSVGGSGASMADTSIVKLLGAQEGLANQIRNLGVPMMEIKSAIIQKSDDIIKAILGDEAAINAKIETATKFDGLNRTAGSATASNALLSGLSGGMSFMLPGQLENQVYWTKIDSIFRDYGAILSKIPQDEASKVVDVEMRDEQKGFSIPELKTAFAYLSQVKGYTGDPASFKFKPVDDVFGHLEESYRNKRKAPLTTETANKNLWGRFYELADQTRGAFTLLPKKEQDELLNIEMRDKKAGFSESELSAVVKLLEQIAQYTGDFTKMDLTISPDLFK